MRTKSKKYHLTNKDHENIVEEWQTDVDFRHLA